MTGSRRALSGCLRARRARSVAVAAALALVLAGCGSGGDPGAVSPARYVTSVCKAIAPFERGLLARSSVLFAARAGSAAERKRMLVGFLSEVAHDARGAVARLQRTARPSVAHGAQIQAAVLRVFVRIERGTG